MADQDPKASRCTATSKTTGNRCTRPAIPGGSVCRCHGGAATQVKAAAAARLRAMVDPALGVLEYAMKGKHKDVRGALTAARKYWTGISQRAKVTGWKRGLDWGNQMITKLDLTPHLISGPIQYKVCSVRVLFSSSTVFASTKPPV